MTTQPEAVLEDNLVKQLQALGYTKVTIKDEEDLVANLKTQLEKHNGKTLSENELKQVLNHLSKGNIYEKSQNLRNKAEYTKANGETGYIELINQIHWCKNQYQVTHQVTMEGTYKNRYDVTVLINGLPLVQIELKRRGLMIVIVIIPVSQVLWNLAFSSGKATYLCTFLHRKLAPSQCLSFPAY